MEGDELREGWIDVLTRQPWHEFATLTYRRDVWASEKVERDVSRWLYERARERAEDLELVTAVARQLPDGTTKHRLRGAWASAWRRGHARPVYVMGVEMHQRRCLHAHAVVWWPPMYHEMRRDAGHRRWFSDHGFARVEAPRGQQDVCDYCSKYVTKVGSELVVSQTFNAPPGLSQG